MIHKAAADAVGEVLVNGKRKGHCVLIAQHMAVTCAHVLSSGPEQPDIEATLRFGRIGLETTAKITGWRALDPRLAPGTDIALLSLAHKAPVGSWRPLEGNRPARGAPVVTFEYQTARADGDPREAFVHYGEGSVISLKGHRFIDPGMSGAGLFYRDPGERLLGLVAWRPNKQGQTEAYAIPAEEIQKLMAACAKRQVTDVLPALFEALTECFLAQVGDNLLPMLQEFVQAARDVIVKPAEAWTEYDIADLLDLHLEIIEFGDGGLTLPKGVAEVLNRLAILCAQLSPDAGSSAICIPIDAGMTREMENLRQSLEAFRRSPSFPETAAQSADMLLRNIGLATARQQMRPLQLSNGNANMQKAAGEAYTRLGRTMSSLLGRRADLLPTGTIFTDSVELWAPEMIVIPAGSFFMGATELDEGFEQDEGPQRSVRMSKFALSRFLVSFSEFDAFCDQESCSRPLDSGWGRDRRPVIYVSFADANSFCEFLSRETSFNYRMPLESEWEYVCKRGETLATTLGSVSNVSAEGSSWKNLRCTFEVHDAVLPRNKLGIHQMIGNLWQWCANEYSDRLPEKEVLLSEADSSVLVAARGGSWNSAANGLRPTYRNRFKANYRNNDVGIRVYRDL